MRLPFRHSGKNLAYILPEILAQILCWREPDLPYGTVGESSSGRLLSCAPASVKEPFPGRE